MDCLKGKIGLSGCGTQTPAPDLFINSLPGISLKSIESLADSEQQTYLGVWQDIEERAVKRFTIELYGRLASRYKLTSITRSINTGSDLDATVVTSSSAEMRGQVFDLDYNNSGDYVESILLYHSVQSFTFYSNAIHSGVAFKIIDTKTGITLDTFTQDLIVGLNTIQVNKCYQNRKIFLCTDCTAIDTVYNIASDNCRGCDCSGSVNGASYLISDGISTLTESTNGYGFNVVYSSVCKYDGIICSNINLFLTPLWYLEGSELMMERITTERINKWTVNKKEAEELKAHYDSMFDKAMNSVMDGISLDTNDCCLDCDDQYQIRETLP